MSGDFAVALRRAPPLCSAQCGTSTESFVLDVTPMVGAVNAEEAFCVVKLIFSRCVSAFPHTQQPCGNVNCSGNGELKIGSSAMRSFFHAIKVKVAKDPSSADFRI